MSYDVSLIDVNGNICSVPSHEEGGNYVLGGTSLSELNITYNYSSSFEAVLGKSGIKLLDRRLASDTIPSLVSAIVALGTGRDKDYWQPTDGNAGYALRILLRWALQHPNAIWEVS